MNKLQDSRYKSLISIILQVNKETDGNVNNFNLTPKEMYLATVF